MAKKLVDIPDSEVPIELRGAYNDPLPRLRRDKAAALHVIRTVRITHVDQRRVMRPGQPPLNLTVYWSAPEKHGWAMSTEGEGVQLYTVGCLHEKTTRKNLGRCLNAHTCTECGHSFTIDSSD